MDKKKNIVVVDDDPAFLFFCEKTLGSLGHNIHALSSGEDALNKIVELKKESGIDVDFLVVDQNMDGMSGINFMAYYKESGGKNIPIIMASQDSNKSLREKFKKLGGLAFFQKPIVKKVQFMRLVDTLTTT